MTNKEALERMKRRLYEGKDGDHGDVLMALAALKKQIPEKPYFHETCTSPHYECPNCSTWLIQNSPIFGDWNFCPTCGQRIDKGKE